MLKVGVLFFVSFSYVHPIIESDDLGTDYFPFLLSSVSSLTNDTKIRNKTNRKLEHCVEEGYRFPDNITQIKNNNLIVIYLTYSTSSR